MFDKRSRDRISSAVRRVERSGSSRVGEKKIWNSVGGGDKNSIEPLLAYKVGGNDGDGTSEPSYTYSFRLFSDPTGDYVLSGINPTSGGHKHVRTDGSYTEATVAIGAFDDNDDLKIIFLNEVPNVAQCEAGTGGPIDP